MPEPDVSTVNGSYQHGLELAFPAGLVVGGLVRDEPRLLALAVLAYEKWTKAKPFWN